MRHSRSGGRPLEGGRTSSTVTVVVGGVFLLSGLANVLVLGTPLNVLPFGIPNVIFSLVAGAMVLILGGYGRFTGSLPSNNPYQRERHTDKGVADIFPTTYARPADATAARELADAERAVARHGAIPAQAEAVEAAGMVRRAEDRIEVWRCNDRPQP